MIFYNFIKGLVDKTVGTFDSKRKKLSSFTPARVVPTLDFIGSDKQKGKYWEECL